MLLYDWNQLRSTNQQTEVIFNRPVPIGRQFQSEQRKCFDKRCSTESIISTSTISGDGSAEGTARIGAFIESKTLVSH